MKLKNTPFTIQHVKNWHPIRWIKTQYKLWKLRNDDPFDYDETDIG